METTAGHGLGWASALPPIVLNIPLFVTLFSLEFSINSSLDGDLNSCLIVFD